jgi:hypothetical protein
VHNHGSDKGCPSEQPSAPSQGTSSASGHDSDWILHTTSTRLWDSNSVRAIRRNVESPKIGWRGLHPKVMLFRLLIRRPADQSARVIACQEVADLPRRLQALPLRLLIRSHNYTSNLFLTSSRRHIPTTADAVSGEVLPPTPCRNDLPLPSSLHQMKRSILIARDTPYGPWRRIYSSPAVAQLICPARPGPH